MLRKVLLVIAATLVVVAVILAVSGGFRTTVGGFRISARSPVAASIAALIAGAAWCYLARRDSAVAADLGRAWQALERHASRLIGAVALVTAIVAASFATRSAAGADASGYLSQAALWSDGAWIIANPLADVLNRPDPWLTTPLGWRPAGSSYQVPTYPPGLPLLMSIPHAIAGINGATAVVIASAAIAVWATGMLAGGIAGLMAAMLIAFTPVFLNQSFQPMSDVPVTAAWMLCFLLLRNGWSVSAGMACAIAILIRPNLAPLAIVPFSIAPRKAGFTMPVAVAGAIVAFIQWLWYGSPLQSGYGSAGELFAFANVLPNASRHFSWLIATAPALFFACFGFIRLRHQSHARALLLFAALVVVSYLVYAVFDHWSYLRFLLPAMAVFAIFAAIEFLSWIDRWPTAARLPVFLVLMLSVIAYSLFTARALETFKLADQLRRVDRAAAFVSTIAPENAVLIAGEQSGSMRYYTGRPILRWEAATPDALESAMVTLEKSGRPVYVVLDAWENDMFLAKFKQLPAVALDWPPMLEAGTSHRTNVWQLSDRARFLAGENLQTIRLP